MKIAHAQLHMYTNMYKFQSSTYKTVGGKLRTKLCPRTDRQTDMKIACAQTLCVNFRAVLAKMLE